MVASESQPECRGQSVSISEYSIPEIIAVAGAEAVVAYRSYLDIQAEIPKPVADAGENAIAAYQSFLTEGRLKASTLTIYRSALSRFFRWATKHGAPLAALGRNDVDAYLTDLHTLKPSTIAVNLTAIRAFFRHLMVSGVLSENPFASLAAPSHKAAKLDPRLTKLKQMVREIGEADGWTADSQDFQAGLVMLAALEIRTTEPEAISRFTGVSLPQVEQFAERLRDNGIWQSDGTIVAEWAEPENGWLAFMLDVWVATGDLERARSDDETNSARED